jgi:lysophospholipase L1-like esterase
MAVAWLLLIVQPAGAVESARAKISPEIYRRTVFMGDSITDGNTYPLLVRDALQDADLPKMLSINAGIGGDTAAGMRKRLDRDVLGFHPTLVTFSAGANDALRGVSAGAYEQDVRAICQKLHDAHVPLILLTPNILGPKQERGRKNLEAYEAVLRRLAKEYDLRIAEVNRREKEDLAAGHAQLAGDDLHPNYEGQRMIARAVLDAMGYPDVKVPARVHDNHPFPGVIPEWRVRVAGAKDLPLAPNTIARLAPDGSWLKISLPETQPAPDRNSADNGWIDDYRTLGASICLRQLEPKEHSFIGIATLHVEKARQVQFHTGAELNALWLNGTQIYRNDGSRGWHIGRESVVANLPAGNSSLVIETGPVFFLSMTDGAMW